jgi:hypothetical protein
MKIGANDITDLKIGATEINEVRLGSVLVWERNSYLLDLYPATAAYSLRKLRSNYTGVAIRVRRSLDNTEQDIGFVGNNLDTASLLAFVGVGNGFVSVWYDQSGNNRNAINTSAINQPQIVTNGLVEVTNLKPSIKWINAQQMRLFNNFGLISQPTSYFTVSKLDQATGINASTIFDSYNNVQHILYNSGNTENPNNVFICTAGTNQAVRVLQNGNVNVNYFNGVINGVNSQIYNHNTLLTSGNLGLNGMNGISIGHIRGNPTPISTAYNMAGTLQEIIIYESNQTVNRENISNNIYSYYN